jgi:preprotein translocase subunit YajC
VLVFVGFYFLMIRPQRRRQQQAAQKQNTVTPGARVRTTAGMYATVVAVDGDDVVLEVAPNVEVRYLKRAIMEVIAPGEADASETFEDDRDHVVHRQLRRDMLEPTPPRTALDQVTKIPRILMTTSWPSPTRTTCSELPLA